MRWLADLSPESTIASLVPIIAGVVGFLISRMVKSADHTKEETGTLRERMAVMERDIKAVWRNHDEHDKRISRLEDRK